jgi:hypothetical protein
VLFWLADTLVPVSHSRQGKAGEAPINQTSSPLRHRTAPHRTISLAPDPNSQTSNHQALLHPPISTPPSRSYQQTSLLAQTVHHRLSVFSVENCDRACLLQLLGHSPDRPSASAPPVCAEPQSSASERSVPEAFYYTAEGPLSFLCNQELETEKRGDWKCCGETKDGFAEPAQLVSRRSGTTARPAGV